MVCTPPFVPPEAIEEQRPRRPCRSVRARSSWPTSFSPAARIPGANLPRPGRNLALSGEPPVGDRRRRAARLSTSWFSSLLSLARTARPQNAARVFQRLTASADLPSIEAPEVARAYSHERHRSSAEITRSCDFVGTSSESPGRGSALLVESKHGASAERGCSARFS